MDKITKLTFNQTKQDQINLVGPVDDVKKKISLNIGAKQNVNDICIDSLVSILDVDGDGEITSEEYQNYNINKEIFTVSSADIKNIYDEAVANNKKMDFSKIQKGLNQSENKPEEKITQKITKIDDKLTIVKTDALGRTVSINKASDNRETNIYTEIKYNEDGSKTIESDTIGKKVKYTIDKKGSLRGYESYAKYDSDRKIGGTKQQNIGECWALSGVNALNVTSKGKEIISQLINYNNDGSVTVNLKGVNKSYTYSAEDVVAKKYYQTKDMYLAEGDTDMNLIEKAIADYRKDLTNQVSIKGLFVDSENPLNSGYNREALYYLTGVSPQNSYTVSGTEKLLQKKLEDGDRYALTTSFKCDDPEFKQGDIITRHTYSIGRVTEDTVYLINPWDSSKEIPYPKDKYLANTDGVSLVDLNKVK